MTTPARRLAARALALAALLAAAPAAPAAAQYFGQNKVLYKAFKWEVLETEHFDVHFYESEREAALDVARMAERSYARLSRLLNHQFRERKTIILYASHSDFQQTNTTPGDVGEGTGGFTDFFKQRNVMPIMGAYAETQHVLAHEMVHQFQMDIFSGGRAVGGAPAIASLAPPLWFMEGMAEYLSLGPTTPETAMWLRDGILCDCLPSIDQMSYDPRIFPYRFGHALWTYIGARWGDEAIGAILQGIPAGGFEAAMRRVLGVGTPELSQQWHDALRKEYFPLLADQTRARDIGTPVLTEARSQGTLHLAPALSPDGKLVAYFSEKDFVFVDLYLADVATGKPIRRLFNSSWSSDYETFRFINSAAAFSRDGRFLAFAGKRGPRDELLILDVRRNQLVRRIKLPLDGATTPSFSPDGQRLVFTGYQGGISDLYVVNVDGTGLRQLSDDKYADLSPVWSPDGRWIAFTTDRGPDTDFAQLRFGNYRLALLDVASGVTRVLPQMDEGTNRSPQWSPEGESLAFISDRSGASNIYLYELASDSIYQLTNLFTGAQGITPLSPVLSWAPLADKLAFVYYVRGRYDVYAIDRPRDLKARAWIPRAATPEAEAAAGAAAAPVPPAAPVAAATPPAAPDTARKPLRAAGSLYRGREGLRNADDLPAPAAGEAAPAPISVAALLDSTTLALPDTAEFNFRKYKSRFTVDGVARPTAGVVAGSNFGSAFYGGAAVGLSDLLGNQQLFFGGYVNGRGFNDAQLIAQFANLSRRIQWATGVSQEPAYFFQPDAIIEGPSENELTYVQNTRRLVVRSLYGQAIRPFSRFMRFELGARLVNTEDDLLQTLQPFDPVTGFPTQNPSNRTLDVSNGTFTQVSASLVYDNSLYGYVGPFRGRSMRLEFAPTLPLSEDGWEFTQATADLRSYNRIFGPQLAPVIFATRLFFFGRFGPDELLFPIFLGNDFLVRGHSVGSYRDNECAFSASTCEPYVRLIGSRIALINAEVRFPVLNPRFRFLPAGIPPVDGAVFYDAGVAWSRGNTVKLGGRDPGDDPLDVRTPVSAVGVSLRTNLLGYLIMRVDLARPINRINPVTGERVTSIWSFVLGPTF